MTKKIGDKKLGGVKSTSLADGVQGTGTVHGADSVGGVKSIAPTSGVGGVKGASAIGKRRPTRLMTLAEREQLLQTVTEEAEKMFSAGILPASKKEAITQAVKLAIDASIATPEEEEDEDQD